MSARGRGRGVAAFTFNVEALGITRGSMPEAALGPQPLFPKTEYKPVPLKTGDDEEYMLALKQELRRMKFQSPKITMPDGKNDVERYKEKYFLVKKANDDEWTPDWQRLPRELMPRTRETKIKPKKVVKKKPVVTSAKDKDYLNKLDDLEKKGDKSDEEKAEQAEEGDEVEEYDDEEAEEENDYIASYFEDGDDYGGGSDDNMDEATY